MIRTFILAALVLALALLYGKLPTGLPDKGDKPPAEVSADVSSTRVLVSTEVGSGNGKRLFLLREEAVIEAIASAPSVEAAPSIRLVGIARGHADGAALLQVETIPDLQRRKVGERIDTWTIIAIEARSVTLASGGLRRTLVLDAP